MHRVASSPCRRRKPQGLTGYLGWGVVCVYWAPTPQARQHRGAPPGHEAPAPRCARCSQVFAWTYGRFACLVCIFLQARDGGCDCHHGKKNKCPVIRLLSCPASGQSSWTFESGVIERRDRFVSWLCTRVRCWVNLLSLCAHEASRVVGRGESGPLARFLTRGQWQSRSRLVDETALEDKVGPRG